MKEATLREIPLTNGQTLEVTISYSLGGTNYFTGNRDRRGYYLHVTPVTIERSEDGSYSTKSFTLFSGMKALLLEVKRKSPKGLLDAKLLLPGIERKVIDRVLEKHGLSPVDPSRLPEDFPDRRPVAAPQPPAGPAPRTNPQVLLTKGALEALPAEGSTANEADPMVQVKFFDPTGTWKWYAIEYNPVTKVFYGLVKGHYTELGGFSLQELEAFRGPMNMGIERDIHFTPMRLSELRAKLEGGIHV